MWELTAENAAAYLAQQGWVRGTAVRVEPLSGGVSNIVLRVIDGERLLVVKQSRPQLRTREAWFSDVERIHREIDVLQWLGDQLPLGSIPRLLHQDRERFVFAMEHAPLLARSWKEMLLAGLADPLIARAAGRLLGQIHQFTAHREPPSASLRDKTVFVQLRVDPFYRRILTAHPDLAPYVEPLIAEMARADDALCHGDYSPKNLLVHEGQVALVDHETGHIGEPCMDVGFFFSHLLLKTIFHFQRRCEYLEVVRQAWAGYSDALTAWPARAKWSACMGHLGVCLIARVDGTSPVDYLRRAEQQQCARELGRALLVDSPADWDQLEQQLIGLGVRHGL
jgi:5-methylthioribose kinase